jgi:4-amino-4-deoxy-L-arabinose transferase-like glycosyltransferase
MYGPPRYSAAAPSTRQAPAAIGLAVALLTLYAAALRADALVGRLGATGASGWAHIVERVAAPVGKRLHPASVVWKTDPTPYTGDPINYIRFAREMRSFYQPHVREPMFLAITRAFLVALGGRDVAVSYASSLSSVLVVPATYLLGAAAFGPAVGLAAAAAWAVEFDAISWSTGGWRDDTFTLFFTLTAWSFIRFRQEGTSSRAVIAGAAAAGACLTRLSSLLYVAAGLAWTIVEPGLGITRRRTMKAAGLFVIVTVLLVGPYVVSCWMATGDPFYAVNYHTQYYRYAQGLSPKVPETALHFVGRQLIARPLAALDTAAGGLFVWPFQSKWQGFRPWSPLLPPALQWSAAAGLVLMVWSAEGRLLLVMLIASLAPYALTWSLGGGGAWRFSEHVYPIYLTAAFFAWRQAIAALGHISRRPREWGTLVSRRRLLEATLAGCVTVLVGLSYFALPLLVTREALASAEAATIEAGHRERLFFAGDWSAPSRTGPVVVRVAEGPQVGVRLPLPGAMDCVLTLKMDPAETADPARQPRVSVFLNRQRLAEVHLTRDPTRMGTYRFPVARAQTRDGTNDLELVASHMVPAAEAGPPFAWLDKATPVAFRLWYVRLEPLMPR